MGSNSRLYNKTDPITEASGGKGTNLTPGPYEAVVKDASDPTRSGRLKVYIPDLGGGDQEDPQNWITVSYASPFMGKTYAPNGSKLNSFEEVEHTYGFWSVPPDRGNTVLVIFVAGDRGRGYWFACTSNKLGHGMIPSIGGGKESEIDQEIINDPDVKAAVGADSVLPLSEFNETDGQNIVENFAKIKRPIHEYQAKRYIEQGLDRDEVRGARYSGSQREPVSGVFGWSTPGRALKNDPADNPDLKAKMESNDFDPESIIDADGRKGGHSFVMDDGAFFGGGQMVRIRSAEGHQMLMDDDGRSMYMINADGSVWIEMAGSGQLSIYTSRGFNLRSKEDINLHSDADINMFAGKNINMKASANGTLEGADVTLNASGKAHIWGGGTAQLGSSGATNISSGAGGSIKAGGSMLISGSSVGLNSGSGPSVSAPAALESMTHADTSFEGGKWTIKPGVLSSIVKVAPSHEPWTRTEGDPEKRVVGQTIPSKK